MGDNESGPEEQPPPVEYPGVEVVDAQGDESIVKGFTDHFTLSIPSATVRYRDRHCAARVIDGQDFQFILEETYDKEKHEHNVSIRRIQDSSEGVVFLRMLYTVVTAFWTGFLFIFCLQVLLFLLLDLAIEIGLTDRQDAAWGSALGVILSIIPFVYGLASAMVLGGAYIVDTWHGHPLIKNFTFRGLSKATVEWLFFAFFLGIPLTIMGFALLVRSEYWWTATSLVWFCCVLLFFVAFAINVIFYEMSACWEVIRNRYKADSDTWFMILKRSILLRQRSSYGGRKTIRYLAMGDIEDAEYTDKDSGRNKIESTYKERVSWRARITMHPFFVKSGMFKVPEEPQRIYTIDDARDARPFVTSYTWGLEKAFCRPTDSRYIAIVRGPGAITTAQMKSSILCALLGTALLALVFLGGLVFLRLGAVFTILLLAIGVLVAYGPVKSAFEIYRVAGEILKIDLPKFLGPVTEDNEEDAEEGHAIKLKSTHDGEQRFFSEAGTSEGFYLVNEIYRVSVPTDGFCWTMLAIEILFFFVWPFISLLSVNNYPLALLYFAVVGITGMRYYFNAAVVLEETGHMDLVGGTTKKQLWKNQSRLNQIVGNITRGRSRKLWIIVLGSLAFVFLALFFAAVGEEIETESTSVENEIGLTYNPNFEYLQRDSLRYPSCQLTNTLNERSPINSMADFTFLAGLAYRGAAITPQELDRWFTQSGLNATDNEETVQQFRQDNDVPSTVSYKLVTFPDFNNFAMVVIRGTVTAWDAFVDTQLWSAAALMQVHRAILPFGEIWNPIIDQLISAVTTIESKSIESVSFYKDTVRFTEWVKANPNYNGTAITGHSLGGGLSIITGAITKTPAVALSGPNAMLTRNSLDPKVNANDLDRYTFNIIPERDVVPMIDDPAQNYQSIRCEASLTDVVGCHNSIRALCEIIYTCGSNGRPVPCECVTEFFYPEPEPINGFAEPFLDNCKSIREEFDAISGISS